MLYPALLQFFVHLPLTADALKDESSVKMMPMQPSNASSSRLRPKDIFPNERIQKRVALCYALRNLTRIRALLTQDIPIKVNHTHCIPFRQVVLVVLTVVAGGVWVARLSKVGPVRNHVLLQVGIDELLSLRPKVK